MVAISELERFFDQGWNAHNLDVLMTFMADDCVFDTAGGPDAFGTRYRGRDRVREGFQNALARFPATAAISSPSGVAKIALKSSYFKNRTA